MAQNPLVLMMALSVPGMSHAIGLGEIHVHSSLNEPLVAEIDIVGATPGDLESLRASMANRETFARFNADKPAFLATATFKVAQNAAGGSVLQVRSRDSFTEPAVDMVVDVRWNNGAVTRQYSLLLDPADLSLAARVAAQMRTPATPASAAVVSVQREPAAMDDPAPVPAAGKMTRVKVGAKATLRGIAWRAGARSEADLQRMMMAMFRANPAAFDGNINRLRMGATIDIPAPEIVAAIPQSEARSETAAQMAAWRASKGQVAKPRVAVAAVATPTAVAPATPAAPAAPAATAAAAAEATVMAATAAEAAAPAIGGTAADNEKSALKQRVQSLEKSLSDMQLLIDRENDKLAGIQARVAHAEAAETAVAAPGAAAGTHADQTLFAKIAGGLAALAGALGIFYWRSRRRERPTAAIPPRSFVTEPAAVVLAAPPAPSTVVTEVRLPETTRATARDMSVPLGTLQEDGDALIDAWISERGNTRPGSPDLDADTVVLEKQPAPAEEDDTVNLAADTANMPAATVALKRPAAPQVDPAELLDAISAELEREYENSTRLDYNLVELDKAQKEIELHAANAQTVPLLPMAQTPAASVPSLPQEAPVLKERRTSLADALKQAISREPERQDLKLKLLETYYAQAATNRAAFLEVVQQFAEQRNQLTTGEWDKISEMGRQIAADTDMFGSDEGERDIEDFAA